MRERQQLHKYQHLSQQFDDDKFEKLIYKSPEV